MFREMQEKMLAGQRQSQHIDMMNIGGKKIKVLPLEQENLEEEAGELEAAKLTQWVLKYIEFIGNFAILVFIFFFISIYWCIGMLH